MNRRLALVLLALAGTLGAARIVAAQDLVVSNVRIIRGTGEVIEQGTIVVRGGRIASVAAGTTDAPGLRVVDARGMTAIAGFIDAHRHIIQGDPERWLREQSAVRMREFLEAGYTTLLSGGGPVPGILDLKQRIDAGALKGPRIIASGQVNLAKSTPEQARAEVRRLAALGIRYVGEETLSPKPTDAELANLDAIVDEGKKAGAHIMVHAASVPAMLAAVRAGADKLVHTPHFSWMNEDDARVVKASGIPVLSTIGFGVPVFGAFNQDNVPTFRDGGKWPDAILDGEGRGREAGYKAVNARTLWDAGVVYGYGTDTGYLPSLGLAHELRAINLMFSPIDMVTMMGPNTAAWVDMGRDIGTLEAGKLADIVLLAGNPLEGYWNFLTARVVIKGGEVVVDKR